VKEGKKMVDREVSVGISHDYARLVYGDRSFYYGYEHWKCSKHGFENKCDCEDREWCFIVREGDTIVYTLTKTELVENIPSCKPKEVEDLILVGIGMYLLSKIEE